MNRWILAMPLIFFAAPSPLYAAESCMSCHRTVEGVGYLEHTFDDWEKSVHARWGVTCSACHDGDGSKSDTDAAHRGVLPSTDKNSSVYFTRVPETCGRCHADEFSAFQKSAHHRELQRTGRGPNCLTCHGSMANHVLGPRDLEMTCTLCHRRPTRAYAALLALNHAGTAVKKLDESLKLAKISGGPDNASQDGECRTLARMYQNALADWHTFRMDKVIQSAQTIVKRVRNALNELRLKETR